jgi:hypothetical protein
MSRGNDFRQQSLQRQAQNQRQFDAFNRHARDTARAAQQGFQDRSRARTNRNAQTMQQQLQANSRRQADRARQMGQQHYQPWHADDAHYYHEPAETRGASPSVLGYLFQYLLFLAWLLFMGWVIVGK